MKNKKKSNKESDTNQPSTSKGADIDPRFHQVLTDPRFRTLKKDEKKVKIDKRFEGMFKDERFTVSAKLDKRGKPVEKKSGENLKKFYQLSDEEKDNENEKDDDEDDDDDDESENESLDLPLKPGIPDARGNDIISDSSDSEDEDEDYLSKDEIEHKWGELDNNVPRTSNVSNRLAVCNVDWDRIRAKDIFILFNSFKPADGTILSVKIFPSEFGKARLAEEEINGPTELVEVTLKEDEQDPYAKPFFKEGEEILNNESKEIVEKLRKYQINRLKYYYAVVECDSEETANALYEELDGMEFEASSSCLDLRFIPDDVEFDEKPTSECKTMPDLIKYKSPLFFTSALQQSKVKLTWDETDPERRELLNKAFDSKEANYDDLQAYLATDESEEDQDEIDTNIISSEDDGEDDSDLDEEKKQKKLEKYKKLLKSLDEDNKDNNNDMDMEITWEPSLKNIALNVVKEKEDELVNNELSYLDAERKKRNKEKKLKKKEAANKDNEEKDENLDEDEKGELDLILMDDQKDKSHFNYDNLVKDDKKSNKRKLKEKIDEDNFKFDADDPRFCSIYNSHEFNIDQSDPHFKRTKAMEDLLVNKKSKQKLISNTKEENENESLSSLIKSIKSKTNKVKKFN